MKRNCCVLRAHIGGTSELLQTVICNRTNPKSFCVITITQNFTTSNHTVIIANILHLQDSNSFDNEAPELGSRTGYQAVERY